MYFIKLQYICICNTVCLINYTYVIHCSYVYTVYIFIVKIIFYIQITISQVQPVCLCTIQDNAMDVLINGLLVELPTILDSI